MCCRRPSLPQATDPHSPVEFLRHESTIVPLSNRRYRESLATPCRLPVACVLQSRSDTLNCLDPTGRKVVEPRDDLFAF